MRVRRTVLALLSAASLGAGLLVSSGAQAAPLQAASTAKIGKNVARSCAVPTKAHTMACMSYRRTDLPAPRAISPDATPSGLSPTNLQSAYVLTSAASSNGSGKTVAIVDAYDDPNAAADLAVYRSQYGLSACTVANGCFKKVSQTGSTTSLPTADTGWAGEISLDLDMVSAICPNCNILLVEATSNSDSDLFTAINEAVTLGATYVSNSWGGSESSSETTYDTYLNHPGVAITVSSGDSGYGSEYPATSRYVTAVGGTTLTAASSTTRGWTETAWSSAGSGCSSYETKPTWQTVTTGCSTRAEADVSAVADPNTGVAVYQTYGASGWSVYGGTSASAPIIAGVYALAGAPGSADYPASYPYSHTSNLYDITSGSNGSCGSPMCTAGSSWDGPTGLGSPNGLTAFAAGTTSTGVTVTNPGSQTGTVGTAKSLTVSASGGTGSYTWTASGLPTGLSIASGTGVISGTPTTAGTYSTTVTATDTASATGSATFTFTISSSSTTGCTASQLLGNNGFESGSTTWTATSGVINTGDSSSNIPRTGSYFAWLDGYGSTHTDTLSQAVTIPSTCTSASLTFYLKVVTAETTTSTAYDTMTVKAGSTTLATYSNLSTKSYTLRTISLNSYIGSTVTLTFTGTEDSSLATSFDVDDTSVAVS